MITKTFFKKLGVLGALLFFLSVWGAAVVPADGEAQILMDQDRVVTATFEPGDWYLYIQAIGNGTTDPAPGQYWYLDGQTFTVTAVPGEDLFLHWVGDIPDGQDPASLIISGTMDQHRELVAVFVPATVTVPNLSGMTQEQAEIALAAVGLVIGIVYAEYSCCAPIGQIISQDPVEGTSVAYGSTVDIVVSLSCDTEVPNVIGLNQAQAEAALSYHFLVLGAVTFEFSDTIPEGQIISQDPLPDQLTGCGAAVDIVVSLGVEEEGECDADVPNLIGLTQAEAEAELSYRGMVLGIVTVEYSDTVPAGLVISQYPFPYALTSCDGASVDIVISLGNKIHVADQDDNHMISLSELLRLVQFYNSDGLHCQAGTEDGYDPGQGDQGCAPHDGDYNPQDWFINVSELLRIIQFFNSDGYHYCPGESTEDGFCLDLA
ncbi:MAG TPA: PASTA domain-containing protein [Candidatus Hydrogenedentes bacterium]|nr:PASTA domain-containing protein [Candidatus Hydrogenedentota bacterium]